MLSIIIPVRNERATVLQLIDRVRAIDCGMPKEIIIVDGASTDGTRAALATYQDTSGIAVILEDAARGKGRAVRTGFARAAGDIVMVQDADLELDPDEIPSLLAPMRSGRALAVFGSRFLHGRGATPLSGYAGNRGLTLAANLLFRAHLTDLLTCYKVLYADLARALALRCDGFDLDAEIACRLLREGIEIIEVPVTYHPRGFDEGKKLSARVGWSVLRAIIRERVSPRTGVSAAYPPIGGAETDAALTGRSRDS